MNTVYLGDCYDVLRNQLVEEETIDLIYVDPPFNTGKLQKIRDCFYSDKFIHVSYEAYMRERMFSAYKALKPNGSLLFHIDYREVHYMKVMLDVIFGRECFKNEIIWAYDYGGRPKNRWPCKHDNILWYTKDPKNYTFNYGSMDRIPYMAPGLCGPEKAKRGKTPTDVWWQTIVPTNSSERVGYPTQKPLKILERIIKIHSNAGDTVLDMFAGSGTTAEAAYHLGRKFVMIDNNPQAIEVMRKRLPDDTIFV